ncbi:DUF1351 domain-containing protein [Enterococcus faecalis]|uniref:DUF1351 domain-containing protein n=1 Tax=Enterococcus faecalis TaxID=1351 RepID=UPI00274884D1|nr:DUF1351 domain-containing protein [Enterococcus faecalis]MDP4430203.1 DUF1351 domain-containing protein [Enterococcus faecalis]
MSNELMADLQVTVEVSPSKIIINNEKQLSAMVDETVNHYSKLIFNENNLPDAKQARADLNKVSGLLDKKRIEVKKEFNKPLDTFETTINAFKEKIEEAKNIIDKNIKSYEENDREARKEKVQAKINEISAAKNIHPDAIKIESSWTNKGSFTQKGELKKKVIEEIETVASEIDKEKDRIKNDKLIIEGYTKAKGLEPYSWLNLIEQGKTSAELIKEIDKASAEKLATEKVAETRGLEQVGENTIDIETGEIVSNVCEEEEESSELETARIQVTATHEKLVALNNFMKANQIEVEAIE